MSAYPNHLQCVQIKDDKFGVTVGLDSLRDVFPAHVRQPHPASVQVDLEALDVLNGGAVANHLEFKAGKGAGERGILYMVMVVLRYLAYS